MSTSSNEQRRELEQLAQLPDADIDTSDIPEIRDFTNAVRGRFYRPAEQSITVRIDADILAWFDARGETMESHINEALREYVEHRQTP